MTPMICLGVSQAVVVRGWLSLKAQVAEQLPGIPFSSGGLQALGRRLRVAVPWEPVCASSTEAAPEARACMLSSWDCRRENPFASRGSGPATDVLDHKSHSIPST